MSKLTKVQGIAFDLDGTLVNSAPGLAKAAQLMLADLSFPTVTEEQIKIWVGNGIDVLLQRVLNSVNAPEGIFDQAKTLFNQHYDNVIQEGTELYPNVLSTMRTLKARGYPLALVTNKPAQFLPDLLKSLQLDTLFDLVLGGGDVIKLKPHPAPLYKVLATFGLFSDELLFVGDSKNDINAAKNAYCPTLALTYGYNYGEPIANSEPDFIVDDFAEMLTLLPEQKPESN